jgi:hypothetical protein
LDPHPHFFDADPQHCLRYSPCCIGIEYDIVVGEALEDDSEFDEEEESNDEDDDEDGKYSTLL